jgi:hypothetical protein
VLCLLLLVSESFLETFSLIEPIAKSLSPLFMSGPFIFQCYLTIHVLHHCIMRTSTIFIPTARGYLRVSLVTVTDMCEVEFL